MEGSKNPKRCSAAKSCCGWEEVHICHNSLLVLHIDKCLVYAIHNKKKGKFQTKRFEQKSCLLDNYHCNRVCPVVMVWLFSMG